MPSLSTPVRAACTMFICQWPSGSPEPENLSSSDETLISPPTDSTFCASFLGYGFPFFGHFSWKSKDHLQPPPSCPLQLLGTKSWCPMSVTSALSVPAHQPPAAISVQLLSIILLLITVSFTPDRELRMQIWWFCTLLLQILLRLSINDYRLKSTLHSMM